MKRIINVILVGMIIGVTAFAVLQSKEPTPLTNRSLDINVDKLNTEVWRRHLEAEIIPTTPIISEGSDVGVWEFKKIYEYPSAVLKQQDSTVGIIEGSLYSDYNAPWWAFYAENVEEEFLIIGIVVDGKTITACDAEGVFCNYKHDPKGGGASIISLTTNDVKLIQAGKEIQFVILFDREQAVRVPRSLVGAKGAIDLLLAAKKPEVVAKKEPVILDWESYEIYDVMYGRVVIAGGPVKEGVAQLSFASGAYKGQLVHIKNYSGSELRFTPSSGALYVLYDVYWEESNGQRMTSAPIEIMEQCHKRNGRMCVFDDSISIVMSETDLILLQVGKTFVAEWGDVTGKRFKSRVVLGEKAVDFNNAVRKIKNVNDLES